MIKLFYDMIYSNRKSQTALEFLVTYGWAFLIIIIMIGTLAYFGILNPSNLLPDKCEFGIGVQCLNFQIYKSTEDRFRLRLKNSLGQTINVQSLTIAKEDGSAYPAGCVLSPALPLTGWKTSEVQDFTWTGPGCVFDDQIAGKKGKVSISMSYTSATSGSSYQNEIKGKVFSAALSDTGGGAGQGNLICNVVSTCASTTIFKMSSLQDAHAEISSQTNYNNQVCCSVNTGTLGTSCATGVTVLKLSANTDAHVEQSTQLNYPINACLSFGSGTASCQYLLSCNADETCVAAISGATDAHVGDCSSSFATKVCCKVQ